jgi:hypothetical protein
VTIHCRRHVETSVGADVVTDVPSTSGLLYYVLVYDQPGPLGANTDYLAAERMG